MLCLLGTFRVSAMALPYFNVVDQTSSSSSLMILVVGYKNDHFGEGNTVKIYHSADRLCCPVRTFINWKAQTAAIHAGAHDCWLLFSFDSPPCQLRVNECAAILQEMATEASLDMSIFTPKTFRKTGVQRGVNTSVQLDAILKLGSWASMDMFWNHYIAQMVPPTYSNIIFNIDTSSPP